MNTEMINSNAISNYNKILSGYVQNTGTEIGNISPVEDFEKILNSEMNKFSDIEMHESEPITVVDGGADGTPTADVMLNNFKNAISNGLNTVNDYQIQSERATELFATGGDIDVHEVMIASEKAQVSMQLALQMRNKLITFYNELKNMNF